MSGPFNYDLLELLNLVHNGYELEDPTFWVWFRDTIAWSNNTFENDMEEAGYEGILAGIDFNWHWEGEDIE